MVGSFRLKLMLTETSDRDGDSGSEVCRQVGGVIGGNRKSKKSTVSSADFKFDK